MNDKLIYSERLEKTRDLMKFNSLSALIIGSRDDFLNEYTNKDSNLRIFLSGFDGTAGDLLITPEEAYIIVDGRYHTQADNQTNKDLFKVEKVGIDENGNRTDELIPHRMVKILAKISQGKNIIVGYDPNQFSEKMIEFLREETKKVSNTSVFTPLFTNLKEEFLGKIENFKKTTIYHVNTDIAGLNCIDKLEAIRNKLLGLNLNAYFVSKLDELAYITNIRGDEIDYNSTFKGYAFISLKDAFLFTNVGDLGCQNLKNLNNAFEILPISNLQPTLNAYIDRQKGRIHIGYDPSSTNCAILDKLRSLIAKDCKLLSIEENPIKELKSIKNNSELNYMQNCFIKADNVFNDLINWVNNRINSGLMISEYDIKNKLVSTFNSYGATRLSFSPICSTGKNSAIIHYTDASAENIVKKGDIILVDAGCYFEAGYATDLTRTFIAGANNVIASDEQKKIYTIVLKAAINGLSAEIPPDKDGTYLDNQVRTIIANHGYDYNHGTGHGIGILVHESPPTISYASTANLKLKENMVFSIEPGIYIEDWGGVRIENIVTLKKHHNEYKANQGWLEVHCMTYAPLDDNLIDYSLLNEVETNYLEEYKTRFIKVSP
ncbi:MAG: M24 family metallopeptidase [Cyanobacteriota bacterium]